MYIDWVGDQPFLLLEPDTGEVHKVHFFATTLGVSSLIYAEAFLNEKLSSEYGALLEPVASVRIEPPKSVRQSH